MRRRNASRRTPRAERRLRAIPIGALCLAVAAAVLLAVVPVAADGEDPFGVPVISAQEQLAPGVISATEDAPKDSDPGDAEKSGETVRMAAELQTLVTARRAAMALVERARAGNNDRAEWEAAHKLARSTRASWRRCAISTSACCAF